MLRLSTLFSCAVLCAVSTPLVHGDFSPKMLAYSAAPNAYLTEHAPDVAQIYDGLFFVIGSWDSGVADTIGVGDAPAKNPQWADLARQSVARLAQAGATENFLGVYFGDSDEWPSPQTLLSKDYTAKMVKHFAAVGRAAKDLGFRGVAIDVEYPYPRYDLDHPAYTYDNYTAEDLLAGAAEQGAATITAVLDAYPDAVILLLPGEMWTRPLCTAYQTAMLETMAKRNAPGGLHLASERSYSLLDPVSQVALGRTGDMNVRKLFSNKDVLEYWTRCCSMAPGVWPLHRVETGGKDYPMQPWDAELAELRQQMEILRLTAKRYIWSFSAHPVWHSYAPDVREKYQLKAQPFEDEERVVTEWQRILREKTTSQDPHILALVKHVRAFDSGELTPQMYCERFGTPGDWMVLGMLSNPFTHPAQSAPKAALAPINPDLPVYGRDS
ncbi:MAG: hypothetical protein WC655_25985, partial [Candidatus Hydrogenedentales bacterium]